MNTEKKHINGDDNELQRKISNFLRAKADIEDVLNDPDLNRTRDSVKDMISDYKNTVAEKRNSANNENYIKQALSEIRKKPTSKTDFSDFKGFANSDISMLTADWVKEWHRQKQMSGTPDLKAEERKDFIKSSLEAGQIELQMEAEPVKKNIINRSLFIRYFSLSAAAVIGALILISSLSPTSPEKIFNSYYSPFEAISPVTRSASNSAEEIYAGAITNYKSGDYKNAAVGFAEANLNNPSAMAPLFYLGLTSIELENISKAITELSVVATGPGEYIKEAQWYLGLAYLKSGDNAKAAECFKKLAESPGYYFDRSEKILRNRSLK